MDYSEAIGRISEFARFGSILGLERMERLMALLGDPQDRVKAIHVAGTNGKGSVCRYIYSVLQEAGYKTGIYTSPYLERFTERIEFNGAEISEDALARYTKIVLEKVDIMLAAGFESPTEFEIVTAIGFCYFADMKADFLVLEVGLGGTGDSTNIIKKPEVAVITSISFDHTDYLGDTLREIAGEKAGIIKEGVPVVACAGNEEANAVIRAKARSCGSLWHDVADDEILNVDASIERYRFDARIGGKIYPNMEISMIGMHQTQNAVCALAAIEVLRSKKLVSVDDGMVYSGMRRARQAGRLEILRTDPYFIIDGAHNEAGGEALARVLDDHFMGRRILLVVGMLKDKNADKILEILLPRASCILATEPDNPRKLTAALLRELIAEKGRECDLASSVAEAVEYAESNKDRFDVVLFAGSLYLAGKVRSILNEKV